MLKLALAVVAVVALVALLVRRAGARRRAYLDFPAPPASHSRTARQSPTSHLTPVQPPTLDGVPLVARFRCDSCTHLAKASRTTTRPPGAAGDGPWAFCPVRSDWRDFDDGCQNHSDLEVIRAERAAKAARGERS